VTGQRMLRHSRGPRWRKPRSGAGCAVFHARADPGEGFLALSRSSPGRRCSSDRCNRRMRSNASSPRRRGGWSGPKTQIRTSVRQNPEYGTIVPLNLPSLCRQPPRIRANSGELSRMRIRRWRSCTNKCEPSRTGIQSPCKRAVVSSILTGGSAKNRALPARTRIQLKRTYVRVPSR
jgi:hypothetical protein